MDDLEREAERAAAKIGMGHGEIAGCEPRRQRQPQPPDLQEIADAAEHQRLALDRYPQRHADAVADIFLADRLKPSDPVARYALTGADIDRIAGLYRSDDTGLPVTIARDKDGLRADRAALLPQSALRFLTIGRQIWEADAHGMRRTDEFGTVEEFGPVRAASPTAQDLESYAGTYTSDEAETVLAAAVEHGRLVLKRRPDTTIALTPIYADAFGAGGLGTVIFGRDAGGRVTELSVKQDRVWDMRFTRRTQ